jgi:hypothetical protein
MKKLLWVPILLLPVVTVFWLSYAAWFSHVSEQSVAIDYVALSKFEFVTVDNAAIAKIAPNILAHYQAMNSTWREVVSSYKVLALALSGMIMILAFIAGVLMLKKLPKSAFGSEAQERRAG